MNESKHHKAPKGRYIAIGIAPTELYDFDVLWMLLTFQPYWLNIKKIFVAL